MRILLVRLSALGDVVSGLHVLAAIRARQPEAHVGWIVEDRFAPLLEGHPQLDRLHVFRRRSLRPWALHRFARFLRDVRRNAYDLALDLQGNLKSGVLVALSGAVRRIGLDAPLAREGNALFVRERVTPPAGHRLEAYLALVEAAVGPGPRAEAVLPTRPEESGYLLLHAGTSRFGAFKQWPADHYAALGDRLSTRTGAPVVLTAGPGERAAVEAVAAGMRTPARIVEPPGLKALADVLAGARVVVAGDTGPAHIAAAVGVPTLVLFGPKDPAVMAPVGPRAEAVTAGVRCSPCALRWCPDPVCMSRLAVEAVEERALRLLGGAP